MASVGPLTRLGMRLLLPGLRRWDLTSSFRVDHFVANSRTVARRIHKHWRREAAVVYPPVNIASFTARRRAGGDFYLCLGRLTHYKRVDLAVRACSRLNRPLVVVGEGEALKALQAEAAPCVRFLGRQGDAAVADLLAHSRALLFPGEEDFGITPLEAMAAGRPVIAYGRGGVLDSVADGETGIFFERQTADSLTKALDTYEASTEQTWVHDKLKRQAESFSEEIFRKKMIAFIADVLENKV